jgi:uncharacterized membrane protein
MLLSKKYLLLFFLVICIWCFGILSPSILKNWEIYNAAKPFINLVYSPVCHQQHVKALEINGENLLVCARCSGIYFGLFLFTLTSLLFSPKIKNGFYLLIAAAIFMIFDVVLTTFGFYDYSKFLAFSTGVILGISLLIFVFSQLIFNRISNKL